MARLHGWAGASLNVDLTRKKIEKDQISPEFAEKYLGGIGFNAARLLDLVRPKVDALSPENVVILGVGPLAGTLYPGSSRLTMTAKSPLTDVFGSANIGGYFGAELKYAGYDQIIASGKSEKPVYLCIDDDEVQLRDASHLWGISAWEVAMRIKEELENYEMQVLAIGQAGENLVRFANVQNPPRGAAGRAGFGALMGSKNLKAIAVRGTKAVKVAQPDKFFDVCRESTVFGRSEPRYEALRGGGSPMWLDFLAGQMGACGGKNFRETEFPNWTAVSGERFRAGGEFTVRKRACFSCPVGCAGFFNIKSGEFEHTFGRTPEFGMTMISLFCDFTNVPAILKMQTLFDEYGMDVMSGGGIFSWAMDCYSRGILTKEDCDGIPLEWGNYDAIIELIPKIAMREGFGNLLAEGEKRAPQKLGRGSEKFMHHIKGMAPGIQEPRVSKLFCLAWRTASRGGDHLAANVTWVPDLVRDSDLQKETFGNQISWGGTRKRDESVEGMGDMVKVCEDISAIINSAETCVRTGGSFELIAKALSAATGIEFSVEKLLMTGDRIFNIQKTFNAREGLGRKDDDFSVPEKFAEPIAEGRYKGAVFPDLDQRLDEYYRARGWDQKTGFQTRAKLKELGLDHVAQELEKVNAIR